MAGIEGKDPGNTPSLLYLQSGPDTPYTSWFLVGDPEDQLPELISGCKLHLMSHSVPMRNMLYESKLAEEGTKENPVKIVDIKPDIFRHFVKFVNSNNFPILSLEEAVDLLDVADKYIVEELKTKLERYILSLLNVDSVFVLLKRPNCLQNETLINAIHKGIQQRTKQLFAKKEFLDLSSAELLHFVTQDTLAVNELELWREILRWAKHKAQSKEGGKLREVMSELLKHIRFCTLHMNDFCKEIVSTGILTPGEVFSITSVVGGKLDCEKSSSVCYKLITRKIVMDKKYQLSFIPLLGFNLRHSPVKTSHMFLTTDTKAVQLLGGQIVSLPHNYKFAPKKLKVECNIAVSLTRITNYILNTSTEQPISFQYTKDFMYNQNSYLRFPDTMKLLPNNKYKLDLQFSSDNFQCIFNNKRDEKSLECKGLVISWLYDGKTFPKTHLVTLEYKTL